MLVSRQARKITIRSGKAPISLQSATIAQAISLLFGGLNANQTVPINLSSAICQYHSGGSVSETVLESVRANDRLPEFSA